MEWIVNRPYWKRSWVIQEFLLAQNVHIYCSNTHVEGTAFRDMLARAADVDLLSVEISDLVNKPHLMRKWPALPLVIGRHCDRYPELFQSLYDLLTSHAYAQSTDPKDKVFALLGLLPPKERSFLERTFPDYGLSDEQVKVVTLAHLKAFAEDQPMAPILRALRIEDPAEAQRLMEIAESLDYIGADNPAAEVEIIAARLPMDSENDLRTSEAVLLDSLLARFPALGSTIDQKDYQKRNSSGCFGTCVGLFVVIALIGWIVWRQRQ